MPSSLGCLGFPYSPVPLYDLTKVDVASLNVALGQYAEGDAILRRRNPTKETRLIWIGPEPFSKGYLDVVSGLARLEDFRMAFYDVWREGPFYSHGIGREVIDKIGIL